MAQKFSLYLNLSVYQNLWFFSGIYNLQGAHRQKVVDEIIDTFNLKPYLDESADMLPLGFKQRLALSCAVMHQPPVLFLDEPTSGVDPLTRREFWNHMNGLVEKGVTVLVSTHFMDEAEYCDRVALVYRSHHRTGYTRCSESQCTVSRTAKPHSGGCVSDADPKTRCERLKEEGRILAALKH